MTKLEKFIDQNNLRPAHLARAARVSRKQLHSVRTGHRNSTLVFMQKVAAGASRLTGKPVSVEDLFDLRSQVIKAS